MKEVHAEVHNLSPGTSIWHRFDPDVKADLFSTLISPAAGAYLIDPIELPPDAALLESASVAGVIVTNANHIRASRAIAVAPGIPIFAHIDAGIPDARAVADGDEISPDLSVIALTGAAPGEIALHWKSDGGTVIIGDALINFGAHSFTFLPAKYCTNQKQMRRSLSKLTELTFERILFAHGTPILTKARERLVDLLDGCR